ncbi:MAG: NTP transferase domain-containing protein [Rubrivivax sp.]|jgi:molybdenum cofactor cytidylyltransferase|nr:NTP transferase domain-containing protein [Rubrivivax sp.]
MIRPPTLVVLAAGRAAPREAPRSASVLPADAHLPDVPASALAATLRRAVESRLPILVVAHQAQVDEIATWVARRDIKSLPDGDRRSVAALVAVGVAERPDAPGWVVLPGESAGPRPETLRALAGALDDHALVFAQFRGRRGRLAAYAGELYPELVALSSDDDWRRLVARYPATGVEVDDPGILPAVGAAPAAAPPTRVRAG